MTLAQNTLEIDFMVWKLCIPLYISPAFERTLHTIHAEMNCAFVWKMEMTKTEDPGVLADGCSPIKLSVISSPCFYFGTVLKHIFEN